MPRAEVGSTRYLNNKLKSKGLQRLRWYCQVCERQMRDENGFKCHVQSESHVRQMLIVGEDPKKAIQDFSNQFQRDFLLLLRTSHGEKKININHFYQEYIANKEHVHMNATRWPSLTEFAKFLGREGICRVEETEKGWMVSWVDNSPEALRRQDAIRKKERQDKGDEEREQRMIREQVERAKLDARGNNEGEEKGDEEDEAEERTRLQRQEGEKIKLNLQIGKSKKEDEADPGKVTYEEREDGNYQPTKSEGSPPNPAEEGETGSPTIILPTTTTTKSPISLSSSTTKTSKPLTSSSSTNAPGSGLVKKNVFANMKKKSPTTSNPLKQNNPTNGNNPASRGPNMDMNMNMNVNTNTNKRPMSQAEKIMREEIEARERKRARFGGDRSVGGGGGGGGGMGNPNRVPIGNTRR